MSEDNIEVVGLASIINSVKNELQIAQKNFQQDQEKPGFLLRRMQIEISLVAEKKEGSDGKLNLKIVSIGGNEKTSNTNMHKVTLDFDISEESKTMFHR